MSFFAHLRKSLAPPLMMGDNFPRSLSEVSTDMNISLGKTAPSVTLRFNTHRDDDGVLVTTVQAFDRAAGRLVASYSLGMMAGWLRRNGYAYETGSNGVWVLA